MFSQSKPLLVLCYIASLVLGLVASSIIVLGSIFLPKNLLFYFAAFVLLGSVALLSCFCFKYFDIGKNIILTLTLSLSVLVSLVSVGIHFFASRFVARVNENLTHVDPAKASMNVTQLIQILGEPVNIMALVVIIILLYNILPVMDLVKTAED